MILMIYVNAAGSRIVVAGCVRVCRRGCGARALRAGGRGGCAGRAGSSSLLLGTLPLFGVVWLLLPGVLRSASHLATGIAAGGLYRLFRRALFRQRLGVAFFALSRGHIVSRPALLGVCPLLGALRLRQITLVSASHDD